MFYIMAKPQTSMTMKFMSNSAKHDKIMKMKHHTPLRFTSNAFRFGCNDW